MITGLGEYIKAGRSDEYRFNCPFCLQRVGKKDKSHHLYVNPTKYYHGIRGWYNCYRCRARGPVSRLKLQIFNTVDLSKWEEFVRSLKYNYKEPPKETFVELPKDYEDISPLMEAYKYLLDRGLTEYQINHYGVGVGTSNMKNVPLQDRSDHAGKGRIILPDYDEEGRTLYWVARTYRNHKLRYKNPPGSNARDKIYHLSYAVRYKDVIITEGVFSAIAAGLNAIATYGKNVTAEQTHMLVEAGFDHYYIALDGDARQESIDLAKKLTRRGCKCSIVELEYGDDPDSAKDFQDRLNNASSFDTFTEQVSFILR